MQNNTIELQVGAVCFKGVGSGEWVEKQFDKILNHVGSEIRTASKLQLNEVQEVNDNKADIKSDVNVITNKPLPKFLSENNASKVQNVKFLATAIWLHGKGTKMLSTADVSTALKNAQQSKINNPSDTLNQNVGKGYCQKDGKHFFVTEEGRQYLFGMR